MINIQTEQRIEFFDIAKGLAIWAVVCYHVMNDMQTEAVQNLLFYQILNIIQLPVFFFISGYFISPKFNILGYKDLLIKYIPKRFRQLICPMLCFSIPYILYRNVNGDTNYNLFTLISGSNPYWFLICLFNYTLLIGLVAFGILTWHFTFRDNSTKKIVILAMWLTLVIIIGTSVVICNSELCINALYIKRTIYYLPSFLFGFLIGRTKRFNRKNLIHRLSAHEDLTPSLPSQLDNITTTSIFIFSSLMILLYIIPKIGISLNYPFKMGYILHQILILSGIVLVLSLCCIWNLKILSNRRNHKNNESYISCGALYSIINILGKYSLSIYLIHYFFRMSLKTIGDFFGWQFLPVFCASLFVSSIIIALSLLIIKIAQQSHFINKYFLVGK